MRVKGDVACKIRVRPKSLLKILLLCSLWIFFITCDFFCLAVVA